MKSTGNFVTGLLIGMVAGSAIALLTAPMNGTETRNMIGDKAQKIRSKASDVVSNAASGATKTIDNLQDMSNDMMNAEKDLINKATDRANY